MTTSPNVSQAVPKTYVVVTVAIHVAGRETTTFTAHHVAIENIDEEYAHLDVISPEPTGIITHHRDRPEMPPEPDVLDLRIRGRLLRHEDDGPTHTIETTPGDPS